jgi:hypothetical protein
LQPLKLGITVLLVAAALCAVTGDFASWWVKFQRSVATRDAQSVSEGIRFPIAWENGPIREIRTKAEWAAKFNLYFTAEIRKAVAEGKPVRLPNGQYSVTWEAGGNEYSLYFDSDGKGGFRLAGLSEGPA